MFVVNFKLDFKKVLLICFIIGLLVVTIVEFSMTKNASTVNSSSSTNYDYVLTDQNFLSTLKQVHENIDTNLGKKVKMSGFVFKMPDFKEDYFVCGRNTVIDSKDTIAGFLCQYKDTKKLVDNEWVEITGVIIKGEYNETMPIIKIGNITKITAPANTFVTK